MSSLQRKAMMSGVRGGLPPRPQMTTSSACRRGGGRQRDYRPVGWKMYFDKKEEVILSDQPGRKFNVYQSGGSTGGDATESAVVVLLHGGGYSGLTWGPMAKSLRESVHCRVLAVDLRGHGDTVFEDGDQETVLDADTMADDVTAVVNQIIEKEGGSGPVILVGHSMGGALAVHIALKGGIPGLSGVCVIDVVEGTAMDALSSMQSVLRSRPKSFPSLSYAVEWSVRSGQVRNVESARVSMPGQLRSTETGRCAVHHLDDDGSDLHTKVEVSSQSTIKEDEEEDSSTPPDSGGQDFKKPETMQRVSKNTSKQHPFEWRINLSATEQYWTGWFKGLSSKFLSVPATKLLVLAGVDRLDRDLTVGQMQGAFQMQVLPQAGHAVHEDLPEKVADILATFLVRNKFAQPAGEYVQTFPAC